MDWVTPAAFIIAIALAMFVVPRAARRIERESYRRASPSERFGWFHEHVDHEQKTPRPRKREPESEEHSP